MGGNCPCFRESFSKRWLKRWRKKGRETRGSAQVGTGFFEVGIQTIDLFLFEFFIEGGVDAKRDRDVFMAHLITGGHDVHTGEVHQSAEGVAELVRGEGVDAHGQAARAVFVLLAVVAVLDVQVAHIAFPQALPALLGHLLAFVVVEHVEAAVLLGSKIIDKDFGDADDADAGGGLGDFNFLSAEVVALIDRDGGVVEVDVGPSEGSGLAAAEAGVEQEHGGPLGGVGRLTDPALLLLGEGVARFRRGPGRGDGLDQRVVHHNLRDGEVIRRLGAAAQVGEGEVGEGRLAVMPVGQCIEHLLEVGRTQLRGGNVHQLAPVGLIGGQPVEAFLADTFGLFGCDEVIVQSTQSGLGLLGIHTFGDGGAVSFGSCAGLALRGAVKGLELFAAIVRFAQIDTIPVAAICAFFILGHKNSFPICLPMHMRYGILDVSAGRESLTTLFFSDIAPPCAPRQLLSYKAAGIFFAQTPPLVETLAGAFSLWISAQEVGGSDVQDVTECKEIICFGRPGASLIIADRARDDAQLLRQLPLRQPGGVPCLADDAGRFGMGTGGFG